MRILVLGGTGMLGHKAYQVLGRDFETFATVRHFDDRLTRSGVFDAARVVEGVDAFSFESVDRAIARVRPFAVINAVGIIKQSDRVHDPKTAIYVNALFPHLLAEGCTKNGCKLIHISTDCVFSGSRGHYTEDDIPDARDLYGRSKLLGEVTEAPHLTLRTSIIGHELSGRHGLVDWFLSQRGKEVRGYANAVFSGLTTTALALEIGRLLSLYPDLTGLYQLSAEPIDKCTLLSMIRAAYGVDVRITPYQDFVCDRSLSSDRYRLVTGFVPAGWEEMLREMQAEYSMYDQWRLQ